VLSPKGDCSINFGKMCERFAADRFLVVAPERFPKSQSAWYGAVVLAEDSISHAKSDVWKKTIFSYL